MTQPEPNCIDKLLEELDDMSPRQFEELLSQVATDPEADRAAHDIAQEAQARPP